MWCAVAVCVLALLAPRPAHAQGAQQCPPPAKMTPCACTVKKNGLDILCEFTEQQHIQRFSCFPQAMDVLKSNPMVIFYLKLRHNNLAKLPSYIFLGLDIRHLTVHNSSLAVIEDSSLSSIGNKLTQLDVSQNSLATIPTSSFVHLNHLLILNMNHNKVTAVHKKAFIGLDTLEILTLYENRISVVDAEAFKGLEKWYCLHRRYCVCVIPLFAPQSDDSCLLRVSALGHLLFVFTSWYDSTKLARIETSCSEIGRIRNQLKLKRLNLGGNELTAVPQKALALLENLKKLEMQENRITTISEGDFAVSSCCVSLCKQITDLLHNPPPNEQYKNIKERLMRVYEKSDRRQFQRLLPEAELGDQKPTQKLRRMRDLARDRIPDASFRLSGATAYLHIFSLSQLELTYQLSGKTLFSTLDLNRAYQQVNVREEDVEKTAIITLMGLFEFPRMCPGLKNAGYTFRWYIHQVLIGLDFVFLFIDDVLIASESKKQHCKHLRSVLGRFEEHGITINVAKCNLGQPEAKFLGDIVSKEGIKPPAEKVKLIIDYPKPQTVEELRIFLGMLNFYREHIPNAASIQAPLNAYLHNVNKKDKIKIHWTEESSQALEACKTSISDAVLLAHPLHLAPYASFCEASNKSNDSVL
ncbi:hypothetical protein EVAR_94311_1 [Eumeta japonica]|uniref:RNA-directed DNA polymerase n=1 Tax=Eumeta variegata TaxID=151549 RepID=A0A4C1UGD4_EUMVA|nr:hypothetical protein EVAR_94311_1 [Eumeta japonica]